MSDDLVDGIDYVSRELFMRMTGQTPKKVKELYDMGKLLPHPTQKRGVWRFTLESVSSWLLFLHSEHGKRRQALGGMGIGEDADEEAKDAKQMKSVADAWKSILQLLDEMETRIDLGAAKDEVARMLTEAVAQVDMIPSIAAAEVPKAKQKAVSNRVKKKLAVWRDDARDAIRQAVAESNAARETHYQMIDYIVQNRLPKLGMEEEADRKADRKKAGRGGGQ